MESKYLFSLLHLIIRSQTAGSQKHYNKNHSCHIFSHFNLHVCVCGLYLRIEIMVIVVRKVENINDTKKINAYITSNFEAIWIEWVNTTTHTVASVWPFAQSLFHTVWFYLWDTQTQRFHYFPLMNAKINFQFSLTYIFKMSCRNCVVESIFVFNNYYLFEMN